MSFMAYQKLEPAKIAATAPRRHGALSSVLGEAFAGLQYKS